MTSIEMLLLMQTMERIQNSQVAVIIDADNSPPRFAPAPLPFDNDNNAMYLGVILVGSKFILSRTSEDFMSTLLLPMLGAVCEAQSKEEVSSATDGIARMFAAFNKATAPQAMSV